MNKDRIEKVQKLSAEIQNFRDCYEGNELWGGIDAPVSAEALIAYLIEHPEFQHIADNIERLNK